MNSRRWTIWNIARTICAIALLCAAAGVSAQAVNKQGAVAVRPPAEQARATGISAVNARQLRRQERMRHLHEQAQRGARDADRFLSARP
jgi:hypothetical protein